MITDQVTLLNETVLECLNKKSEVKIFKAFMDVGIKILDADYGFAWLLKNPRSKTLELVCKSPNLPFTPTARKTGRNLTVIKTRKPIFVDDIKETPDVSYVSKYFKSYAIIPLVHKKLVHGSMVLCFKQIKPFTHDKKTLGILLGNSAAQAITIHRLMRYQQEALILTEKQKTTEVLLEQEKLKMEFIANATHEFRTPLAIMRGYIYLATQNKGMSKESVKATQEALKIVDQEIVNLSELLSDLVLITSQGDVQKVVELKPVNVAATVRLTAQKLKALAKDKGISISDEGPKDIKISGDEKYLERLFLNIVRNAITYGKSKIKIVIKENRNDVAISITDDGIGISKEDLPHIFERFFRADKSRHREGGHSGLGLAIAKWIAEIHEGKIRVKSTLGKGSTFTIVLPKKAAQPVKKVKRY